MGNGIDVRFEYGGMSLVCDEEAFGRLREIIATEVDLTDAVPGRRHASNVQFISVSRISAERRSKGLRWIELVQLALASCVSGTVFIVGVVTIFQWIIRKLA